MCSVSNKLPSEIVVVDPTHLKVLSSVTPPEPVTGRITWGRTAGRDYVYAAGADDLVRFRYRHEALKLDRHWGPVAYRTGGGMPGTGPGLMGHFVVVQTNFLPTTSPMTVTAVDTRDSSHVFQITPFPNSSTSWIVSKPALDAANDTVVTHDYAADQMAALHLDPHDGFSVEWSRSLHSLDFSALVGGAAHRQIVIPDLRSDGDRVAWLDERTGQEQAVSDPLAGTSAPGNIVVPGFGGRFYYGSTAGQLWELRPRASAG